MKVKVCGLSSAEQVNTCVQYEADYCGFILNYPKSHRFIQFEKAKELTNIEKTLLKFVKKNNLNQNIFKELKSIQNLKKLKQEIYFSTNFGRDIEYYTGIVFEVFSGNKEIARGGRYDDLLKSLGAKKSIPAVGAAINLNNI